MYKRYVKFSHAVKNLFLIVPSLFVCGSLHAQWRQAANTALASGASPTIDIVRTGKVLIGRAVTPATSYFTEARLEAFNGAIAQVQAGNFGSYLTGNTWGGLGQAGTIGLPIPSAYGLAMIKQDRLGFYNLVDAARNSFVTNTKDMVAGFGTNNATPDLNQRFLIRYFTGVNTGSNIAPVAANVLLAANPNGSVGINTENPSSTFFVDATAAASSSLFKSMFILNDGSISNFTNATFSALGQEGNSTINLPIHGLRTQVGPKVALNVQVNATNTTRQEAEITWQDLDFLSPATSGNGTQDRLSFYFRNGTNNPTDRKRAMTLLANATTGIDVENPTEVGVNTGSILFTQEKRPIRFDVPTAPMRSQSYYRLESDKFKADEQDIPDALGRILRLEGRTYRWVGYNGDQNTPTYGFNQHSVATYLPDAHIEHDDGFISIDYDAILAAVVEAIKEMNGIFTFTTNNTNSQNELLKQQSTTIANQEKVIAKQQDQINDLIQRVNTLSQVAGLSPISSIGGDVSASAVKNSIELSNRPNPSNGYTQINYNLNTTEAASLVITDQSGRVIKSYNNIAKGRNSIDVYKGELSAGIYIYSIYINGKVAASEKMIITQ
jgi:uncharacterized coiled-coil protein SlyX